MHSGDLTKEEIDELALHFSVYYGFAKGEALCATAEAACATRPGPRLDPLARRVLA